MALEILLTLLGAIVVGFFSRRREFRADAGGSQLAGREKMVGALQALQRVYEPSLQAAAAAGSNKPSYDTLKISGKSRGILRLIASHPPLEERIRRLQGA